MQQVYTKYTDEDHEVWKILFDRQLENLQDKGHHLYLSSLSNLASSMNGNRVPDFRNVDGQLMDASGWSIEVVPGLIPVVEFFELLSVKRFCSSTWLRKKSQLDYLEEPDMFHDTFGHLPLLADREYADFVQAIGKLGVKHKANEERIAMLKSYYWFTIEFGLIKVENQSQIYGAGLISSFGETNQIYTDKVTIKPFDLTEIINTSFINSEMQNLYYQVDSMEQLYDSLVELDHRWS